MLQLMRYKTIYFLISAIVLIPGIFSLLYWGLKPAIDFTGGTLLELKISRLEGKSITSQDLEMVFEEVNIEASSIQSSGEDAFLIRFKPIDQAKNTQIQNQIKERIGQVEELRFETVGPTLGKELLKKTLIALITATFLILAFVAYQFKDKKYGVCAVLAMLHDTFIVLGVFSLLGHFFRIEVDTLFVTAVLTTLSFSVHDTIVVYDRIRESRKNYPKANFEDLINKAVAETLSRSVNNSMTIIFMLLALYLLGGETTKWFVLALLLGVISGTYSSTFTAAPLLIVWEGIKKRKKN